MSSFVLFTRYGPPDLIVEVGTPISQDPIMLSGLFQAIISFTDEVAQTPLQVLQTKGFTVQFKQMFDDYRLIVGTNHTIVGLDLVLDQIGEIIADGYKHNVSPDLIEQTITEILNNYVEFSKLGDEDLSNLDQLPDSLVEMFIDIPNPIYEILFYGLLCGYRFLFPKTESMDLNRNLVKFIEFVEQSCCSDLDPTCLDGISLTSRRDGFKLKGSDFSSKDLPRTKIIKELVELVKKQKFMELKLKLISTMGTLSQLQHMFMDFDPKDHTDADQEIIDNLRYLIGSDLEYYLLLRLKRESLELVTYLQENTKQTEWMSQW